MLHILSRFSLCSKLTVLAIRVFSESSRGDNVRLYTDLLITCPDLYYIKQIREHIHTVKNKVAVSVLIVKWNLHRIQKDFLECVHGFECVVQDMITVSTTVLSKWLQDDICKYIIPDYF